MLILVQQINQKINYWVYENLLDTNKVLVLDKWFFHFSISKIQCIYITLKIRNVFLEMQLVSYVNVSIWKIIPCMILDWTNFFKNSSVTVHKKTFCT